ncbi:MAG: FtsX-like permease family protein [Oscillospiraceae bacterium]
MKLAAQNVKLNSKFYIPYLIASSITAAMFYIMGFLAFNPGLKGNSINTVMAFGVWVIAIFSVIILLYINSFLMKRRQKEIGLYNVLGMEKRHIGRIFGWETVYSYLITMVCGLGGGILLSKLFLLLLYHISNLPTKLQFEVSGKSAGNTLILFAGIFLLMLVLNQVKVHFNNPVELLRGGNVGEKEPKANWFLAILGAVLLGAGYYISLTTKNPLSALEYFFIAVLLVIAGTYLLFIAGTVAILKLLKKNKKFYYKTNHFTAVSGLLYRMKQNATGLASICILATMVMVMMSVTVSLQAGEQNIIDTMYPQDICANVYNAKNTTVGKSVNDLVEKAVKEVGRTVKSAHYGRYLPLTTTLKNGNYVLDSSSNIMAENSAVFTVMTAQEYQNSTGQKLSLADGEAAYYSFYGSLPSSFQLLGQKLKLTTRLSSAPVTTGNQSAYLVNSHLLVVKDEKVLAALMQMQMATQKDGYSTYTYSYAFDTDGTDTQKIALSKTVNQALRSLSNSQNGSDNDSHAFSVVESRQSSANDIQNIVGSLLFLGMFLSLLFVMATVLIIYYKQISEGYDDTERFNIMQKVGMSRAEVRKSIHSQVLLVFFLPLIVACVHMLVVFPYLTKLLKLFQLTNVPLFAACAAGTAAVFAAVYVVVYAITTRTYYHIVSPAKS